jgi:hypothetical protein
LTIGQRRSPADPASKATKRKTAFDRRDRIGGSGQSRLAT